MKKDRKHKALGLLSGGLDSSLACLLIKSQGVDVTGICYTSPFFSPKKAKIAAKTLKIPLICKDFYKDIITLVKNPKHGFGSALNPCIDCHSLMIKKTGEIMKEKKYDFMFTGEVLGQRPMSQNKDALNKVANDSGYQGYILRPLSAKLLDETFPEKEKIVDRNLLCEIAGRSRQQQRALAVKYGLYDYPNSAGGCLLTEKNYSRKLKDILTYNPKLTRSEVLLLKTGRHFRINHKAKLIIGKDEKDNRYLEKMALSKDFIISTEHLPGPVALIKGKVNNEELNKAMKLVLSYADIENSGNFQVFFIRNSLKKFINVHIENKSASRKLFKHI